MPEWLKMVIECSKAKRAKIVLVSIETFLNILSKQATPEDPVKKLQNLIVMQDGHSSNNNTMSGMSKGKLEEGRNIY